MSGVNLICVDDIPISVRRVADVKIKYPYELFKKHMGLDDIRLHWLLSPNSMIAGGSALNWVWGEKKNEDIDFFFRNAESAENFKLFIQNIDFVSARITNYAETYFNKDDGLIIQVVGSQNMSDNFIAYGPVVAILENFDMHVCKFAVDCDYIYTTTRAVQDLLKLTIDTTGLEKNNFLLRLVKYIKKGFYPSPRIMKALKYEIKRKEVW